jgi:DtxR family Mn-dependent transcriptional regulator
MEQYIEVIYDLQNEWGAASVTDIAKLRGVKSPSVTYVVQKLKSEGLVNYEKYRSITLTQDGIEIAQTLQCRHDTLKWFFNMLGIDEQIAEKDACEIEHIADPETIAKLTEFVEFVKNSPADPTWLKHFREFQRTGKYTHCEKKSN